MGRRSWRRSVGRLLHGRYPLNGSRFCCNQGTFHWRYCPFCAGSNSRLMPGWDCSWRKGMPGLGHGRAGLANPRRTSHGSGNPAAHLGQTATPAAMDQREKTPRGMGLFQVEAVSPVTVNRAASGDRPIA